MLTQLPETPTPLLQQKPVRPDIRCYYWFINLKLLYYRAQYTHVWTLLVVAVVAEGLKSWVSLVHGQVVERERAVNFTDSLILMTFGAGHWKSGPIPSHFMLFRSGLHRYCHWFVRQSFRFIKKITLILLLLLFSLLSF